MSAAEEPDDVVAPNQRQDLIPHWKVVQARLAENLAEARFLRRQYRLSCEVAIKRGELVSDQREVTNGREEEAGKAKAKG